MEDNARAYHINEPVFVRTKKKFNFGKLAYERYVKAVFINERIIELPFVIQGLASLKRGAAVLDVGCMESLLPMQLAGLGYHVTGLDFRKYPFFFPGLDLVQADATKMPLVDRSFDAVTCVSMIEHVGLGHYQDPCHHPDADADVVREFERVLKPGGLLLLSVPFGVLTTGVVQRTYDAARLKKALGAFLVEEKRYYIQRRDQQHLNDFWQECDEPEASGVQAVDKTACVCLIKARKP